MVKKEDQRVKEQAAKAIELQRRLSRPPSLSRRLWAKWRKFQKQAMSGSDRLPKEEHWSRLRICIANFMFSYVFEAFMGLVILFNIMLIMIETDRRINCIQPESPECPANAQEIKMPDRVCLGIYCIELGMKIYVYQRKFLLFRWNVFDTCIVVVSILGEVFGSFFKDAVIIRVIRITRLVRMLRLLTSFQELYLMMAGMATTIRTIFWATIVLMAVLSVQSLIAVELLRPVTKVLDSQGVFRMSNCLRCHRAFDSVVASMITFFQTLLMGEGVNELLVPLIEEDWTAGIFLFISTIFVYLGLSNLILSVIVEKANESRKSDSFYTTLVQTKLKQDAKKVLIEYWKTADVDMNDRLTLAELRKTYHEQDFFRKYFESQDMELPFLEYAFKLGMDGRDEEDGELAFEDFAEAVVAMKNSDMGTVMSLIKCQVATIIDEVGTLQNQVLELTGDLSDHMAINARAYNGEMMQCDDSHMSSRGGDQTGRFFGDWWSRLSGSPGYHAISLNEPQPMKSGNGRNGHVLPEPNNGHANGEDFEEPVIPLHQPDDDGFHQAADDWSDDWGGPQADDKDEWDAALAVQSPHTDLADMLKSSYGESLPLDLPNLDEVQRNFAKLCERVEAQLDRLDIHWLDDKEERTFQSKKEVYTAGARLLGRLGKSMTTMLNECGAKPARPKLRRQMTAGNKYLGANVSAQMAPPPPITRQGTQKYESGDDSGGMGDFTRSRNVATVNDDDGHKGKRRSSPASLEDGGPDGRKGRRSSDPGDYRSRSPKSRRTDAKEY